MASRRPSELKYDRTDTHLSGLSEAISYTNRHKRSSEVILSSSKGSRDYEDSQRSELENKDDSHRLIDELINKSKNKVVNQRVKPIPNDMVLYARPFRYNHSALEHNNSRIIDEIYKDITSFSTVKSRLSKRAKENNIHRYASECGNLMNHPRQSQNCFNQYVSANQQETHLKKIAVSGLVTYNFTSVKARKNLAFNDNDEAEILSSKLSILKKKLDKRKARTKRIYARGPVQKWQNKTEIDEAIEQNYDKLSTEEFLKYLREECAKDEKIYGETAGNLRHLQNCMLHEKVDADTAQFVIEEIKLAKRPIVGITRVHHKKISKQSQPDGLPKSKQPVASHIIMSETETK